MFYTCPEKSRNMTNNANPTSRLIPNQTSRLLSKLCQQFDAEQLESSPDSTNDEDSDADVADNVIDSNFKETLNIASNESPPSFQAFGLKTIVSREY